ncbi:MAG: glycogen debranching protein GlgX [Verrucomicrobia bacterium]|nr:glycogen debranching protein GlgX [Verrucomicrobiota bacterium]
MKTSIRRHLLPSVPIPTPYGAHVVEEGVQFTLFSRHATRVWLMLFDAPDAAAPDQEYELTVENNRIGDVWHIHVKDAREGQYYLYRMDGVNPGSKLHCYNPDQWLLDPYALAVSGAPKWGSTWDLKAGKHPKNGAKFPKGVIIRDDYDWAGDHTPRIPLEDAVIYETHVRGFTVHPSARVKHPGTYRGLIEKIPYIRDLGVTSVELLPLQEFNEMEYYVEKTNRTNLRNFWGYSTLAFFAPNGRYAADGVHGQQVREFKEMVKAMHAAGMEVILDVVFNHTAEGGDGGPTYSFRGIDNSIYYMMENDGQHYRNYTGCGNTVNCNHPIVRDFILNSLRYWVLHMHVDGFRFDLASIFARDVNGDVLPNPGVVELIAEDPVLRETKLIAEAWDAAGLYQVGSFPNVRWSEWNGRYRDDVRAFWNGAGGKLGDFATRLTGSADLYDHPGQTSLKTINFVTCHDGFTLRDIVSYNEKHNLANGEKNRDGDDHNNSNNYGHEGSTSDPQINATRKRQQKNLMASILLSQGVPMILAGDEFSRTQNGSNNAYCQDNEISWIDWSLLKQHTDLYKFTKDAIAFRRSHPALRQIRFLDGQPRDDGWPDVKWYGPDGGDPDWDGAGSLACLLNGRKEVTEREEDDDDILLVFNRSEKPVTFRLPFSRGQEWTQALTTEEKKPTWRRGQKTFKADRLSVNVFTSSM